MNVDFSVPKFIKSDEKRIKQILFNLIGNATKFTFKGGITISVKYYNGRLKTEVADTGIGIGPEDIQKLFQFFGKLETSKKVNKGGMGLGLTISRMIIHQLKGEMNVKSQLNKGTSFIFEIKLEPIINIEFTEEIKN